MPEEATRLAEPKTEQVMARIRSSIVSGQYSPGFRLPTFSEMEGDFAVGRAVIQRALDELKRDGFVRSEGRRGLYVTENPPHLCQYGLVMPSSPGEAGWCHLMTALNNEAYRIERSDGEKRFRFYYGAKAGEKPEEMLQQLQEDLQAHRLAGLLVHCESAPVIAEVMKSSPAVPHVYLWANEASSVGSPCLTVDGLDLLRRSLSVLKQRARRRVALISMAGTNLDVDLAQLFAEFGLEYRAPWMQWVGRSDPQTAQHLVTLLTDYPADVRPDALVVADDNLVPFVSSGLVAAGVKVGTELELVAHCNWPWPPQSVLPMIRIGFDLREVMKRALATLAAMHSGMAPEPYQLIASQFEWETQAS